MNFIELFDTPSEFFYVLYPFVRKAVPAAIDNILVWLPVAWFSHKLIKRGYAKHIISAEPKAEEMAEYDDLLEPLDDE